jgi:serine/threonine protein kinase
MSYDAREIGLSWNGSLETLSTVPRARCNILENGVLKDHTGTVRCQMVLEETVADNTLGKLQWVKRSYGSSVKDLLVKKPVSQKHSKQEAVIQWLANKTLSTYNLGEHCPRVIDIFSYSNKLWFSMEPVYSAPILDDYMKSLPTWSSPNLENGLVLLKIIAQIAMVCFTLEQGIGFNHRDLKPDNILVKLDLYKSHSLRWKDEFELKIAPSHTAILVDFGFSCLGPGRIPWIQSGDNVLPPFDACPKVGRDIFMILVFLLWKKDVRESLIQEHLEFFKESLHLSTDKLTQIMNLNKNPIDWVYILITERGFHCPALDPLVWMKTCALRFPEVLTITRLSSS